MAFSPRGKLYYADPGPLTPKVGDRVLVPTDDGDEVATCMWAPQWVSDDIGHLPVLVGLAADADVEREQISRRRRAQARVAARRLVREHGLPMKIVGVDHVSASDTFTIYFTAEGRVDFRALVRDLNRTLDTRVHLRQLSARDSAKLQGGIGSCGRDLCCSTFLTDFEPVSIRMAKDQNLALNPLKISGACGRLMCCLRYEHPLYEEFAAAVPALGAKARTPDGPGRVVGHDVPRQQVVVALDSGGRKACDRADVCSSRRAHEAAYPAAPSGGCDSPTSLAGTEAADTAQPAGTADQHSAIPPADAAPLSADVGKAAADGPTVAPDVGKAAADGPTFTSDVGRAAADGAPLSAGAGNAPTLDAGPGRPAGADAGAPAPSPDDSAPGIDGGGHHRIRRRRSRPADPS